MDIHGENSFKAKSYASAAFAIENLQVQLTELPAEKNSRPERNRDINCSENCWNPETGKLKILDELVKKHLLVFSKC